MIHIALLGFGVVGSGTAEVLTQNKAIIEKAEKFLKIANESEKKHLVIVIETLTTRALINQEQQSA